MKVGLVEDVEVRCVRAVNRQTKYRTPAVQRSTTAGSDMKPKPRVQLTKAALRERKRNSVLRILDSELVACIRQHTSEGVGGLLREPLLGIHMDIGGVTQPAAGSRRTQKACAKGPRSAMHSAGVQKMGRSTDEHNNHDAPTTRTHTHTQQDSAPTSSHDSSAHRQDHASGPRAAAAASAPPAPPRDELLGRHHARQ